MSVTQHHQQLEQEWREASKKWSRIGEEWQDSVRAEFERDFWLSMSQTMPDFLGKLSDLADTINKAKKSIH